MLIQSLSLSNFRNIKQAEVRFGAGLNIIHGANAQGKTNLLEAVYLLALADSYRTNNDAELVNLASDTCLLRANLLQADSADSLRPPGSFSNLPQATELALEIKKLAYNKTEKSFSKDSLPLARVADFIGNFNAVLFAPEDLLLIKSGPQLRRQFLNRILAQAKQTYIFNLQKLNQLLQTKNRLLKDLQAFDASLVLQLYKSMSANQPAAELDRSYLSQLVAAFDGDTAEQQVRQKLGLILSLHRNFVKVASTIIFERLQLVQAFNELVQNYQEALSLGKEVLTVRYLSCVPVQADSSLDAISASLEKKLAQSFASDLFKGHCSIGPQRDDLEFYLNEKNCRLYASQGQQRTVILALKLAECDYLTRVKQIKPVLLLDDVLSELDAKRQQALLANITNRQVLLTCTELAFMPDQAYAEALTRPAEVTYFLVKQGEIFHE